MKTPCHIEKRDDKFVAFYFANECEQIVKRFDPGTSCQEMLDWAETNEFEIASWPHYN